MGWGAVFVVAGLALRWIFGANTLVGAVLGALIMLGLLVFAFVDWRLTDEVSREAYKISFYWGTVIAISIWGIALSFIMLRLGNAYVLSMFGYRGSLAIFALGGLSTVVVQVLCASVVGGAWWLSKR
ncbi:MAG: hypothetical protein ABIQ32_13400 [Sphingomicrobium sp.]